MRHSFNSHLEVADLNQIKYKERNLIQGRKRMKKLIASMTTALTACGLAFGEYTPLMVSIVDPVQLPSDRYDVGGLRLNIIYGDCNDFAGLDIGIISHTAGDFYGLAVGGVNKTNGRFYGAQVGLVNINDWATSEWDALPIGAQFGIVNYSGAFCGLQDGLFINLSSTEFVGLQSAFVNGAGRMYGCQLGLGNVADEVHGTQLGLYGILCINFAGSVSGCQIGLLNVAGKVESGLQIGLLNINASNGWAPVLPIVNGHF